ncbi:MAG: serine/threonine-protein kinase [Myxococcota bacterium]
MKSSWAPPPVRLQKPPVSVGEPGDALSVSRPPGATTQKLARAIEPFIFEEEIRRGRAFFRAVIAVTLITACCVPFLPGPHWLRLAAVIGCSLVAIMGAVVLVLIREPHHYSEPLLAGIAGLFGTFGVGIIYYVGVFSAGTMALALGVYFFGTSRSRCAAWTAYATVASTYLALSSAVAAQWIGDPSLFSSAGVHPVTRWFQVFMGQVILAATFYLARQTRASMERGRAHVRKATRALRQRDALLAEAQGELARATRPGAGRHTGITIDGIEIGERIGRGAMGEVYKARNARGKSVAVKFLHPNLIEKPKKVKRFLREAEAASAVKSPHVPRVFATGWLESPPIPYLAMELLDGHDLGWHLRRSGTLELQDVVEMVDQVSQALADVRDAGVVHRDLKPANVFLADTMPRTWKVLDFGLSKLTWATGSLTRGHAVGTPSYMAPEQVKGPSVDHLADLYALTAIAYRALVGVPPFSGDEIAHVLYRVVNEQPASPAQLGNLPVDIELVLAVGMAKDRDQRFGRVEELATAMRAAYEGRLDDEIRRRGWAILKRMPWGSKRSDAA